MWKKKVEKEERVTEFELGGKVRDEDGLAGDSPWAGLGILLRERPRTDCHMYSLHLRNPNRDTSQSQLSNSRVSVERRSAEVLIKLNFPPKYQIMRLALFYYYYYYFFFLLRTTDRETNRKRPNKKADKSWVLDHKNASLQVGLCWTG